MNENRNSTIDRERFEKALSKFSKRVLAAYDSNGMVDTYKMLTDIDKILADAFNHEKVIA